MMKLTYRIAAVFAVLALVGSVQAEEKSCGGCGEAKADSTSHAAAKSDDSKGCPIAAAMEQLPKMSFAVGDKKVCCPKAAAGMAKKSGAKVRFVVADKTFAKEADAKLALAVATEKCVLAFAKPTKCNVSGAITVAGKKLNCEIKAAQTAKIVKTAMDKVKFAYLVGDKKCGCPIEAGQVAKKTGKEMLFVVAEEKTGCPVTARLNLARAKYKAAVEALLEADAKS